jgi:VanZ family protein
MRPFRWSLLWALVILVLCLFPGQRLPDWNWVALFDLDKLVHAFLFFVLAVLLAQALQTQGRLASYLVWAVIMSMAYGLATEFMQGLEALGRRTDLNDMIANTLGAIAGGAYARWRQVRDRPLVPFAFLR